IPPKKPLASRRICERMNGSGSAPILVQHPQYTALESCALTRRAFAFAASRWEGYEPCFLCTRSALAGEERNTARPRAETSNPAQKRVSLTLGMAALPPVEDVARANMARVGGSGQV